MQNQEGRELYVPEGNAAVVDVFLTELRPDIPIIQADLHINDPEFAAIVAGCMARLLDGEAPQEIGARYGASPASRGHLLDR
jgi:uncharacterized protein (UPF0261 family)